MCHCNFRCVFIHVAMGYDVFMFRITKFKKRKRRDCLTLKEESSTIFESREDFAQRHRGHSFSDLIHNTLLKSFKRTRRDLNRVRHNGFFSKCQKNFLTISFFYSVRAIFRLRYKIQERERQKGPWIIGYAGLE